MKKKYFGKNYVIDVYKFMAMCGLLCDTHGNIKVSHEIMERKLNKRYEEFPDRIKLPRALSFSKINKESVLRGEIILVIDDCNNIVPYQNPYLCPMTSKYFNKEMAKELRIMPNPGEEMPERRTGKNAPGYIKYMTRHPRANETTKIVEEDFNDPYGEYADEKVYTRVLASPNRYRQTDYKGRKIS